ncbi:MAG: hypothetical protein KAH32_04555 [Chlamydiia bacterium]|nr:hypothetical protein [Chlamydiia bacterium]
MSKPIMRKIKDDSLIKGMPASSKFLSTIEYKELYPDRLKRSINYIFDPGMALTIPENEAFRLIKKYPELKIFSATNKPLETEDDLDEVDWKTLKQIGGSYGIELLKKSKDFIKAGIRQAREDGVVPVSIEEYLKRKEEKTVIKNRIKE